MSQIEIRTVRTSKELDRFIDFRTELYKDDPCAVPYLFMDEKNTLSKKKNPSFDFCEAEYYMAYRDGKPVGRIAAIINHRANEKWNRKNVRFGYLDMIDDIEVTKALIEKVKDYGRERGMENIIGPMGFIDMDREGMLVDGYDIMATMYANHNFPYYPQHMDMLGFVKDNDWIQKMIKIPHTVPPKFERIANMIRERYHIRAHKLTKHKLLKEGYGHRLFKVLNECYKDLYEYSELTNGQIDLVLDNYLGMANMDLITFIFDETDTTEGPEGKMIGFGVTFPSFSEALRRTKNGRLFPFGWFHMLRTLKTNNTDTADLLLIGILPEYRAKGANAVIFDDLIHSYTHYGFTKGLTLAMMETNAGVLSAWQYLETETVKRLRSYKKSLIE